LPPRTCGLILRSVGSRSRAANPDPVRRLVTERARGAGDRPRSSCPAHFAWGNPWFPHGPLLHVLFIEGIALGLPPGKARLRPPTFVHGSQVWHSLCPGIAKALAGAASRPGRAGLRRRLAPLSARGSPGLCVSTIPSGRARSATRQERGAVRPAEPASGAVSTLSRAASSTNIDSRRGVNVC
jgi:hypothetical protein